MIQRPLEQIVEADLQSLIAAARAEGVQLDFKRGLPGNTDEEKKEFLADASSFANKMGGDVVFGMDETRENNRATGIAGAIVPIAVADVDAAVLRLEAILRDGLSPRLPEVRFGRVGVAGGEAIVMRVGQSFIAPHQVAFQRSGKFFSRNNAGKYQMDVDEIGRAFRWRDELPARVALLHRERVNAVRAKQAPVQVAGDPRLVLHVVPMGMFSAGPIDVPAWLGQQDRLRPLRSDRYEGHRYNIDGLLFYGIGPTDTGLYYSYSQLFRTGVIESAAGDYGLRLRGSNNIPILDVEADLLATVGRYRDALRAMNVSAPYVIHVSMSGTYGWVVPRGADEFANRNLVPIDRDLIELPSVIDVDPAITTDRLLRPVFDALWQAGGHERCPYYNAAGVYERPRR